ncbi:Polyadenylate-binding proteinB [Arachis hypogaea]|nr:Polyadenylate-binding proteinB [Arachis hypogaea]
MGLLSLQAVLLLREYYNHSMAPLCRERRHDDSPDYTIFVGDLAADVTDYHLQETFRGRYSSVKGLKRKAVYEKRNGRSASAVKKR